jgi:hypothetical protein
MPFELHSLFFYYNFFVEILKLKRQGSIFHTEYHTPNLLRLRAKRGNENKKSPSLFPCKEGPFI